MNQLNLKKILDDLKPFGQDSETNNACCHKVEHKPNKDESFNVQSKLKNMNL